MKWFLMYGKKVGEIVLLIVFDHRKLIRETSYIILSFRLKCSSEYSGEKSITLDFSTTFHSARNDDAQRKFISLKFHCHLC